MKPLALLIDYDVIEFIGRLSPKERAAVWQRMRKIRGYPYNSSDYSEVDPFGHYVHFNVSAKYAIKYWIDEADHQIKVLDIIPSDRRK